MDTSRRAGRAKPADQAARAAKMHRAEPRGFLTAVVRVWTKTGPCNTSAPFSDSPNRSRPATAACGRGRPSSGRSAEAADGRPFLIDFQISFALPSSSPLAARALGGLLRLLQRCDDDRLLKHQVKHRPDQAGLTIRDLERLRPWWIRLHRQCAAPFRTFRRGLLVRLGIRSACGHAFSESFPEIAHRWAAA